VREAVVWHGTKCPERRYGIGQARSTDTVSPVRVIGFRASDVVVMAGLRDLDFSHRGSRASAAAPMVGNC